MEVDGTMSGAYPGATDPQPQITVGSVVREAALVVFGILVYFGVRVVVEGDGVHAFINAAAIHRFEEALHIDWEVGLQQSVLGHESLVRLFNWVYIWGHWPVLVASMVYLFVRRRNAYRRLRTAMVVSGLIGLVIFLAYPVAPPRLAGVGVADTIALYDSAYQEVGGRSRFTNEYAALPSFHFGWNLLAGLCVASAVRSRTLRAALIALPVLMAVAITATGNHFIVDALLGGVIALLGLLMAFTVLAPADERIGVFGWGSPAGGRRASGGPLSAPAPPPPG